jgi:hypothetical protein
MQQNLSLKKVSLIGIFQMKSNRSDVRKLFTQFGAFELVLFKPDYTDDESDDHDNSEEESNEEKDEDTPEEE